MRASSAARERRQMGLRFELGIRAGRSPLVSYGPGELLLA
jgi:hypothetical protein